MVLLLMQDWNEGYFLYDIMNSKWTLVVDMRIPI